MSNFRAELLLVQRILVIFHSFYTNTTSKNLTIVWTDTILDSFIQFEKSLIRVNKILKYNTPFMFLVTDGLNKTFVLVKFDILNYFTEFSLIKWSSFIVIKLESKFFTLVYDT